MILTVRPGPQAGESAIVALFGVGLVGGAVLNALHRRNLDLEADIGLSWGDPRKRSADLDYATQTLSELAAAHGTIRRIDVVWAAGRAGFGAVREELALEIQALEDVIDWTRGLRVGLGNALFDFHMLSSAGGLFEGQRFVDGKSVPRPSRPYGEAKLAQEQLVADLRRDMTAHIYRPSSVYGFSGVGGRAGLLNTLLDNAAKHVPSRIFGGLDTVRDYVLSSDIGKFIVRQINKPVLASETFLLASGKPTSVGEMLHIASKVIGRSLYLKLDVQPSNANHITYRKCAMPDGWQPTDLETGIRQVAYQLSLSFEGGARRW
jgi:nucleoside-diphosphate-sugar epimerase